MKRFLTPQEKKALSYGKDGRNMYGESRAASRKSIATRKAKAARSLRRGQQTALAVLPAVLDEADPTVRKTPRNSWRKFPDAPLGEYVRRTLNRRAAMGMNSSGKASSLLRKARTGPPVRPGYAKGPLQEE